MNDLKTDVKNLKKTICQIYEGRARSERNNQEESFRLFIKMALITQLHMFIDRYRHYGLTDADIAQSFTMDTSYFEVTHKQIADCDLKALGSCVNQYTSIVANNPAYTDVLSLVVEEMFLDGKKGNSFGQFLTPSELAIALAELMPIDSSNTFNVGDIACGSGSLILAPLMLVMRENPQQIKNAKIYGNDIDPFMCCTVALQIIVNTLCHDIDPYGFKLHCSDAIREWGTAKHYVVAFETPRKVFDARAEIRQEMLRETGFFDIFDEQENIKSSRNIHAHVANEESKINKINEVYHAENSTYY
jgi:SAM-dependent methyltransferase